ncbi:hypothetical protein B0T16DRAFT_407756 [Cercophora newfieldiana]|uniref:Uncharacterized protein n=1 Tax=Cercophora newfieldiana TaxID=92897 RepID=A0AA40CRM7_9PEZI|nr:hypothetical protein B0T16DRAFT_407756 [Cercophora newfieldiana]
MTKYIQHVRKAPGHLLDIPEINNTSPDCYIPQDLAGWKVNDTPLEWAEGYNDGEEGENMRSFLVRYFDSSGSYGWVRTGALSYSNPKDPNVNGVEAALAYLRRSATEETPGHKERSKRKRAAPKA